MSDSTMLRVEKLEKRFVIPSGGASLRRGQDRVLHAVSGVSFDLEPGEVLTIVGESGCGKSTIAKLLLGMQEPTGGRMEVAGRELGVNRTAQDRRLIQLVAQNPWSALNRRRSLGHALEQPLVVNRLGGSGRERRAMVLDMVERVGLTQSHLDSRPGDVSGGELARAVLARALLLTPKVLVLDEPTASLDASVKATVIKLLVELRRELGLTMVLITHELGVARAIADRAAVMYLGRFVEVGDAALVLRRPVHPYTRMLLRSEPVADPGHPIVVAGRGEVPSAMAPPPGCAYHPRCEVVSDECELRRPPLEEHAGVLVACHRVLDLGMPQLMPGAVSDLSAKEK